ncbi:uncharacterized protein LOC119718795 [Patiria miniata]|uniref:Proline-rich transmembrane protein 3/4 domain-containing protein n=1 Tax=Patiria miniata TaxID=46514 RepID=A0A913Z0F1_PATMI|nr:uncharacterized protein LOC119718795 [Patiria miniata]XP_038044145.1 uncharacterized protein LOC119718795 [Patiria miniata]
MDANESAFGCVANADIPYVETAIWIHAYVFASLFILLVVVSSFTSFRMFREKRNVKFLLTVEILMIIFGLMRALFLLADPYRVREVLPALFVQFLEDLAVPCLTSAFVLVQTTFWQLTKIRRLEFQRLPVLIGTIAAHFVLIAVIDILVVFVAGTCMLLLVCQALTTLWGFALSLGFFWTVRSLHIIERGHRSTLRTAAAGNFHLQKASQDQSRTSPNNLPVTLEGGVSGVSHSTDVPARIQSISVEINENDNKQQSENVSNRTDSSQPNDRKTELASNDVVPPRSSPRRMRTFGRRPNPLRKVMIVGVMTSCIGFLCFLLGIYGMIVFNNPLQPVEDVMGWFVYQTLQRSVEFGFGITLSYLAWQRNTPTSNR